MLPPLFVTMLRGFDPQYAEPLIAALDGTPPALSVRANTLKGSITPTDADLVPWCEAGFYLSARPLFAADPHWHQGRYYVQDASSMACRRAMEAVLPLLDNDGHMRVLDACAAPGGKTTAALEVLPPDSLMVANELDRHRANILLENLAKEGAPNVVVTNADAAAFGKLGPVFDIVTVDAPCSGEGMMRKEPEAIRQWSPALVADCATTQRRIVDALWDALKPGGIMIYSTCTFNRSENEDIVGYLVDELGAESLPLPLADYPGVWSGFDTAAHCYRFAPGHVRGEGLFVAAVRKPGNAAGADNTTNTPRKADRRKPQKQTELPQWLANSEDYISGGTPEAPVMMPERHAAFIRELGAKVRLLRAGLPLGTLKGREYAPAHELTLSTALAPDSFPTLDLDYDTAIAYLHGEALTDIPAELPKGYVIVRYDGLPLGFIKNIGRRANNLYPDALRLRMDVRPGTTAPKIL